MNSTGSGPAIGVLGSLSIYQGAPLPELTSEWFKTRTEEALRLLEPRYRRALNVNVPLGRVTSGFARRASSLSPLRSYVRRAQSHLAFAHSLSLEAGRIHAAGLELASLRTDVDAVAVDGVLPITQWRERCEQVLTVIEELSTALDLSTRDDRSDKVREALDDCWSELQRATEWIDGDVPAAWNNSVLVISGEAGRGKSHLLAETLSTALDEDQPAVLVLGHTLLNPSEPWSQILAQLDWPGTAEQFLTALSARAKASGRRALLMVDALNEGEGRLIWPAHLASVLERVGRFESIGVVLSVRTVALEACVPEPVRSASCSVIHDGFAGIEYHAVAAFFRFYGLIGPAAPLLLPEFREPLFLDLYCRTAQLQPALLTATAPSLPGVITRYLAAMDQLVRARLDVDPVDPVVFKACMALARSMREAGQRWLSRDEAKQVTQQVLTTAGGHSKSLFAALISERIIIEDVVRGSGSSHELVPVVRFAYERLADHLIAQGLLDEARGRDSFDIEALGQIVSTLSAGESTIDALAVLLPQQAGLELTALASYASPEVGPRLPERVLQSLLLRDKDAITDAAVELMEETLLGEVRPAADRAARVAIALACSPGHRLDHHWLTTTLTALPMYRRDMTWTAATAGRPRRPTPYGQLLRWVEVEDDQLLGRVSPDSALAVASTLMWAFTSSDRFLRDQATRRLIKLSVFHPYVLTSLLQSAIAVDDVYVLERVCAVAYGVALRGLPDDQLQSVATALLDTVFGDGDPPVHILLRDYARNTVRLAHQRKVVSDVQWCAASGPWSSPWPGRDVPSTQDLEAAYPLFDDDRTGREGSLWASIHLSVLEDGDFARYVIGTDHPYSFPFNTRLLDGRVTSIPDSPDPAQAAAEPEQTSMVDRLIDALPATHPLHAQLTDLVAYAESLDSQEKKQPRLDDASFDTDLVCRFVFVGVVERGWTPERFGKIDQELDGSRSNGRSSHKRERIGKKYQWQSWHEALARLADTYHLRREAQDQPTFTHAAQIPFARDLDPSHLLAGNPEDASNPHSDEQTTDWWLPLPTPSAPDLSTLDSQCAWVADQSALLDTTGIIFLPGHLVARTPAGKALAITDDSDWILLHGTVAWYWDLYGRTKGLASGRWADHGVVHRSVLIKQSDVATALQVPPKRYQPHTYSQDFTDGPFLGEFPDQPAFADLVEEREDRGGWTTDSGVNASVLLAADRYVWEGSIYDCSLHHTVSVTLPSARVLDLMAPGARPQDGAVYDENNQVIAFAPDVYDHGDAALIVRADIFHGALRSTGLALGRVIFQERRSGISGQRDPFPGMITRTSLHIHLPDDAGWNHAGSASHDEIIPPRRTSGST
ncbi:hypothetical protein SAMN05660733_07963 [Lentzea albidocapillata]|uniref:ATP-binding protein n=1 Tax=Lentzea albidocapillata TaxID=40571 RepID=A0A1W2FSR0_9PSEU|nr:hypothetical protein SAMN05660733_07963 [Lentzea albidocapillata]